MNNSRLYRSKKDKMLGGVCGGLAEYLNVDSTIIRLLFILAAFLGGTGVVFYIIAWIIIPRENESLSYNHKKDMMQDDNDEVIIDIEEADSDVREDFDKNEVAKSSRTLGLIFIAVGLILLLNMWFPYVSWNKLWPVALVAGGLFLIFKK